jgi:dTDP-4-amino-4,6-dideoxygalactose transaminase
MNIPFLDLKAQYKLIKDEITPAIQNVLDNTAYVLGRSVFDFEKEFAEAHDVKYCHGLSSGTDGNHIALWALGIGPGDEVIIPANTFIATAWGATLCGAKPVFVDCHPESYNIDPAKVEAAITSKTKAIVAVHLYGQPADMDPLKKIADKHNIFLVEDCAQAHLAEYNEKKIGGLSEIGSFSFYPGKNLGAYGEGGAVITNNEKLAQKMKMLRDHGAEEKYHHSIYGHNYRMDGIQGAVLGVKLKHLHDWTNGRRRVAQKYNELLADIEGLILPKEMEYAKHVYHLFVVQVKSSRGLSVETQNKRDEFQKYLSENGISTGLHYPIPLHLQKCFAHLGYKKGDFPVTEALADQGISLPMFPELTDEQLNYISEKIHEFFK